MTALVFFALGVFFGLRWAANIRRIESLAFQMVPNHDAPIPHPHIDQEYRA